MFSFKMTSFDILLSIVVGLNVFFFIELKIYFVNLLSELLAVWRRELFEETNQTEENNFGR